MVVGKPQPVENTIKDKGNGRLFFVEGTKFWAFDRKNDTNKNGTVFKP